MVVYSPGEVEEILGLTAAMVRRYADAMEMVTGNKVTRVRRARVFTEEEVAVLKEARALLETTQSNLSIDQAVRRVLGFEVATSSVSESMSLFAPMLERLDAQTTLIEGQTALIVALQHEMKTLRRELKASKR